MQLGLCLSLELHLQFKKVAECMTPFCFRHKFTGENLCVPCGKCPACIKRRSCEWSFRLMEEEKVSDSAFFITLTYDTSNVPITERGFMSLEKRGLQLFFKRLRKLHVKNVQPIGLPGEVQKSLKYYAVGEYGGRTNRPHYHIILFNAKIELIAEAWKLGHIHYGNVTGPSIGYTLKYMSKKGKIPMWATDDREKEFGVMSKGLGKSYITPDMVAWHKASLDERMYCNLKGGDKVGMPRYFKQKIYTEEERQRVGFYTRLRMIEELEEIMRDNPDYYRDKAQSDAAAFRLMNKNSSLNNKI